MFPIVYGVIRSLKNGEDFLVQNYCSVTVNRNELNDTGHLSAACADLLQIVDLAIGYKPPWVIHDFLSRYNLNSLHFLLFMIHTIVVHKLEPQIKNSYSHVTALELSIKTGLANTLYLYSSHSPDSENIPLIFGSPEKSWSAVLTSDLTVAADCCHFRLQCLRSTSQSIQKIRIKT